MTQNIRVEKESYEDFIKKVKGIVNRSSELVNAIIAINSSWDQNTDARIVDIKLIRESLQSYLIMNELIVCCYDNLEFWDTRHFGNEEARNTAMRDRLYFLRQEMENNLFISVFLRYENFIRLITASVGITNHSLNIRISEFIDHIGLNAEYKHLMNILIYTRNTIHTGGIRIQDDNTVSYKGKDYQFIKGETPGFWNFDTMLYLFGELFDFIYSAVNSDPGKIQMEIKHNYSDLSFEYT